MTYLKFKNIKPRNNMKYTLETNPEELKKIRLEEAKVDTHHLDYDYHSSSSSCYVSEIRGIIFGGLQSRFWMLRKHFNSMNLEELDDIPFLSWQCLSLQLPHRDVDIVIKDEQ